MPERTAKKRSMRIKDLPIRAPLRRSRKLRSGLRGITAVLLLGLGAHGGPTTTTVTPKKGKPYGDQDSTPDIDYYVA